MTSRLSQEAAAILDAYNNSPFDYDTGDFTACAAVLRAAADIVVPEVDFYPGGCCERSLKEVRSMLLDIVAELEAIQ